MPTTTNSTKLNPLAPKYNPISPGIISNTNNQTQKPFQEIIQQIIPQTTSHFIPHQFYAYTYYVVPVPPQNTTNNAYSGPKNTPPRLLGRSFGPREVVDGRSRAKKEVLGKNERMWVPNRNERKVLGFGKEIEESSSKMVLPLKWDEEKTSVMIKNIPYDCSRHELMKVLDEFCMKENGKSNDEIVAYDFLYLPVDFKTKMSRGFAFVNFTNAKGVRKFFNAWNMVAWDSVHWRKWTKAIQIVTAKIQGKEALAGHFSGSYFACESDEFLPVTFDPARDGSGQKVTTTVVGNRRAFHQRWAARKA